MTGYLVVAGGGGFIGSHVVAETERIGFEPVLVRRGTDLLALRDYLDTVVAVIDCAGLEAASVNALRSTFPRSRYVLLSSASVYLDLEDPSAVVDEHSTIAALGQRGAYVDIKLACEHVAGGPETVIVRPVDVVGPGDPNSRLQYWAALGAPDFTGVVFCSRGRRVEFVDVRDLTALLLKCAVRPDAGGLIVNARGPSLTAGELVAACNGSDVHFIDTVVEDGLLPPLVYSGELCSVANGLARMLGATFRTAQDSVLGLVA